MDTQPLSKEEEEEEKATGSPNIQPS